MMTTSPPVLAHLPAADADLVAAVARYLAAGFGPGSVAAPGPDAGGGTILLDGPLGAGKTHFARAFIRARLQNPVEDVPSPSFTLVQAYDQPGGAGLWHVDLYRLDGDAGGIADTAELGLDDAAPGDIRLIEWPERLGPPAPDALIVALRPVPGEADLRDLRLCGDPARWERVARAVECAAMAAGAGWAGAEVAVLAADASARRYLRLTRPAGGETSVLMDAPPGSCGPYLAMTDWLRGHGFHAPEVLAAQPAQGLLLLEDMGDALLARAIEAQPDLAAPAYLRIADLLADLHRHPPAPGIPVLDGSALADQVGLFAEWYAPAAGAPPGAGAQAGQVIAALHAGLAGHPPAVTALRDFHAENIVWRGPDSALGLLDFQDAVAAHPAYDLVSALQDPRREVPAALEAAACARYCAATATDAQAFAAAYALLGAQRNLRIMGIFTRLCLRDGKPRYLAFMQRCWELIGRNLAHPALAPLADVVAAVPAPTPEIIEGIAARCGTMHRAGAGTGVTAPQALMLFAAGRGTRMAPLTNHTPKPLIPVAGVPLIDHALALARSGGARRIVVNTHHLGGQIADHLAGAPDIALSPEPVLLETGGGLRQALPLLGGGPVLTLNPDAVWTGPNPIAALRAAWDGARMDALLMLVPLAAATGRIGAGDFALDPDGRLIRGGPLVYTGAQIIRPDRLAEVPEDIFSLNRLWDLLIASGRAFGVIHPGGWCDVGRPEGIAMAEALLAAGRRGAAG